MRCGNGVVRLAATEMLVKRDTTMTHRPTTIHTRMTACETKARTNGERGTLCRCRQIAYQCCLKASMGLFVHIGATTSETWLASFLKRLNIVEGLKRWEKAGAKKRGDSTLVHIRAAAKLVW